MRYLILLALLFSLAIHAEEPTLDTDTATAEITSSPLHFVGSKQCIACHQVETAEQLKSDHHKAMQIATAETVLANFDDSTFSYNGIKSRFYKKGDAFWVNTDGADGQMTDYQIKYTFGFDPLQQYLIELAGGRLQALSILWDTRPKIAGGQRWYHLYPDEKIDSDDELHWTGLNQNWNFMCASCHSTHLEKNYNPIDRSFNTTWSEINVSCEACHGPASEHLLWAQKGPDWQTISNKGLTLSFDERQGVQWIKNEQTGSPIRSEILTKHKEIETCGRCHSRASLIKEDVVHGQPLLDTHHVSFLNPGRYHADGQIDDEVYVYGSFLQSKMYQKGVTCSDCHTPHTQKLRVEGNALCLNCHSEKKFESENHHFHPLGSEGASCVACHMPSKTYMGVDERHDHSLRVPRPDLSNSLGTPNACNQCHSDKSADWATEKVTSWYGKKFLERPHYGKVLFQVSHNTADSEFLLSTLIQDETVAGIVRGTALNMMPTYSTPESAQMLALAIFDKDPMVRLGVAHSLNNLAPGYRFSYGKHLLTDPVLAIRIETARALAPVVGQISGEDLELVNKGIEEYIAAQKVNADRPESQVNLGSLYGIQGQTDKAVKAFQAAINLQKEFIPAYVNLADMYRSMGDEKKSEETLRQALKVVPDSAVIYHSLGLSLIRQKRLSEALAMLARAARLEPLNVRYTYIYAVALNSFELSDSAVAVLKGGLANYPEDRSYLNLLVNIYQQQGKPEYALKYARELAHLYPHDQQAQQQLQLLETGKL